MGSMKVAISMPDPLFDAADKLARKLKVSRSRLYARAVSQYLDTHGADAVREQLDAVYAVHDSRLDEGLTELQRRSLARRGKDEAW